MSSEGVVKLITRALEDDKFRVEIKANPDAALAQFDLTADEIAAIKNGNAAKLQEMGIDERVSKLASPTAFVPQSLTSATYTPQSLTPGQSGGGAAESLIPWVLSLFKT